MGAAVETNLDLSKELVFRKTGVLYNGQSTAFVISDGQGNIFLNQNRTRYKYDRNLLTGILSTNTYNNSSSTSTANSTEIKGTFMQNGSFLFATRAGNYLRLFEETPTLSSTSFTIPSGTSAPNNSNSSFVSNKNGAMYMWTRQPGNINCYITKITSKIPTTISNPFIISKASTNVLMGCFAKATDGFLFNSATVEGCDFENNVLTKNWYLPNAITTEIVECGIDSVCIIDSNKKLYYLPSRTDDNFILNSDVLIKGICWLKDDYYVLINEVGDTNRLVIFNAKTGTFEKNYLIPNSNISNIVRSIDCAILDLQPGKQVFEVYIYNGNYLCTYMFDIVDAKNIHPASEKELNIITIPELLNYNVSVYDDVTAFASNGTSIGKKFVLDPDTLTYTITDIEIPQTLGALDKLICSRNILFAYKDNSNVNITYASADKGETWWRVCSSSNSIENSGRINLTSSSLVIGYHGSAPIMINLTSRATVSTATTVSGSGSQIYITSGSSLDGYLFSGDAYNLNNSRIYRQGGLSPSTAAFNSQVNTGSNAGGGVKVSDRAGFAIVNEKSFSYTKNGGLGYLEWTSNTLANYFSFYGYINDFGYCFAINNTLRVTEDFVSFKDYTLPSPVVTSFGEQSSLGYGNCILTSNGNFITFEAPSKGSSSLFKDGNNVQNIYFAGDKVDELMYKGIKIYPFAGEGPGLSGLVDPKDGRQYKTVVIGNLEWTAENYAYMGAGQWVIGFNDETMPGAGRLYKFSEAIQNAPPGWRIPTESDCFNLYNHIMGTNSTYWGQNTIGTVLKAAPPVWNGIDTYGFRALPAGRTLSTVGIYTEIITEHTRGYDTTLYISSSESTFLWDHPKEQYHFSVRFVRDV